MNNDYILSLIQQDKRLDEREFDQYRDIKIELNVSKNAEGSARCKIGDTEVIVGVKFGLLISLLKTGLEPIDNDKKIKVTKRFAKKYLILEILLFGKMIFGFLVPTIRTIKENKKRKKYIIDQSIKKYPSGHCLHFTLCILFFPM